MQAQIHNQNTSYVSERKKCIANVRVNLEKVSNKLIERQEKNLV